MSAIIVLFAFLNKEILYVARPNNAESCDVLYFFGNRTIYDVNVDDLNDFKIDLNADFLKCHKREKILQWKQMEATFVNNTHMFSMNVSPAEMNTPCTSTSFNEVINFKIRYIVNKTISESEWVQLKYQQFQEDRINLIFQFAAVLVWQEIFLFIFVTLSTILLGYFIYKIMNNLIQLKKHFINVM